MREYPAGLPGGGGGGGGGGVCLMYNQSLACKWLSFALNHYQRKWRVFSTTLTGRKPYERSNGGGDNDGGGGNCVGCHDYERGKMLVL